jgi:tetratricopeptide (TPR) repeat protein
MEQLGTGLRHFREAGFRIGEADAHNGIGAALLRAAQHTGALDHYRQALDMATQAGEQYEMARALTGLGDTHDALHDRALAQEHWRRAEIVYRTLDVPEADHLRAQLEGAAIT